MQNANPEKTFEELSTQAGPYKDALDAQIAAINERTQVEIFNAKQALEAGSDCFIIGRPITKGDPEKNIQEIISSLN